MLYQVHGTPNKDQNPAKRAACLTIIQEYGNPITSEMSILCFGITIADAHESRTADFLMARKGAYLGKTMKKRRDRV